MGSISYSKLKDRYLVTSKKINSLKILLKHLNKPKSMTLIDLDRIIEMAWEDRTPFEAIEVQFGLTEAEVIKLMRKELKPNSFKLWRKRVNSGVSKKHLHKRSDDIKRFKSARQRVISNNKISKR